MISSALSFLLAAALVVFAIIERKKKSLWITSIVLALVALAIACLSLIEKDVDINEMSALREQTKRNCEDIAELKRILNTTPANELMSLQHEYAPCEESFLKQAISKIDSAYVYLAVGKYDRSWILLEQAYHDEIPDNYKGEIWQYRAYIHQLKGEYSEAIAAYDSSFALDLRARKLAGEDHIHPFNAKAIWGNKGMCYRALGRYRESILAYIENLRIDAHDYKAWHNMGVSLAEIDSLEQAEQAFGNALKIHPDEPNVQYCLASLYRDMGEDLKADSLYFISAKQLAPIDPFLTIGALTNIVQHDRTYIDSIQLDSAFASYRNEPTFRKLFDLK